MKPRLAQVFRGHSGAVTDCRFSRDGRLAASVGVDLSVRVWDLDMGQAASVGGQLLDMSMPENPKAMAHYSLMRGLSGYSGAIRCCAFDPTGRRVLTVGPTEKLALWDAASGVPLCSVEEPGGYVQGVYVDDGRQVLSVHLATDKQEYLRAEFSMDDGRQTSRERRGGSITQVMGSPAGRFLVLLDPEGHTQLADFTDVPGKNSGAEAAWAPRVALVWLNAHDRTGGFDTRGSCLAVSNRYYVVSVLGRAEVGDLLKRRMAPGLEGHPDSIITSVDVVPDGSLAATTALEKTVRLWDLENGTELARIELDQWTQTCALAPDGRRLLLGTGLLEVATPGEPEGEVQVWDLG
jgi:WD40 repeat protein